MSGSVNKVILIGNLGADPEVKSLSSGQKVVNLRVATSDNWTDKNTGEKRERTEWHLVSVFSQNAATYAEDYLSKGDKVYVEGKLQTRKWEDQSGVVRYSTEVLINSIGGQLNGLSTSNKAGELIKPKAPENESTTTPENINDIIPF